MSEARRRVALLASVVGIGVAVDQITKAIAEAELRGRPILTLIDGFLDLRYARNPGAFFSLGAELPDVVRRGLFLLASTVAGVLITRLYFKAHPAQTILRWALMLLLAGALGNLIDRAIRGEVIDFVHLHWRGVFDWATFNVADVLIAFGLGFLVLDLFHRPERKGRPVAQVQS